SLGAVCDDFLVPALNVLCERFSIPPDVAGATLMAAGCNAPELFAMIISTFVQPSTVGPGAILGSAPFNLMASFISPLPVIIGAASWVVPGGLVLDPYLMVREIVCLGIALGALICVLRDDVVQWWEGLIMFALYIGYVLIVVYTRTI
ncbi:hypothetical protein T492DRAFT_580875, partial [Pavlovales sp. CCMP2436]